MSNTNTKTEYKTVEELLSDPKRWTQSHSARNAHGMPVSVFSPEATCFCLYGALRRVYASNIVLYEKSSSKLKNLPLPDGYVQYNDTHTHEEVMALVKKAKV